jgi:hypothetical protein
MAISIIGGGLEPDAPSHLFALDTYRHRPEDRQVPEQHSALAVQEAFLPRQEQAGSPLQSKVSSQSVSPSQSSSRPSEQLTSENGGLPQSEGQSHSLSPLSHAVSPQKLGCPQSSAQFALSSPMSHAPSPQQ